MRAMKNSGLSWLGDIPADWELLYPKQLFQVRKERAREDDVMLTASQHLGMISQDEFMEAESYTPVAVEKGHDILKHVEPGDFVISMRSFQGGLEYSRVRGKMSSAYLALYSTDERVEDEYFKWLFKSDGYISSLQSTSNLVRDGQALRFANFIQVFLPLPPSSEQRAIAAYLDKACSEIDRAIESSEASITEYNAYKWAVVNECVTSGIEHFGERRYSGSDLIGQIPVHWRKMPLKKLGELQRGTGIKRDELKSEGLPCVRYGELYTTYSITIDAPHSSIDQELYDKCRRIEDGDLLIVLTGENNEDIGRAVVNNTGSSLAYGGDLLALRMVSQHPRFIAYALNSAYFGAQRTLASRGDIIVHMSAQEIAQAQVVIPPIEEQVAIAGYLDEKCAQIDAAIAAKRGIIDELKAYKKSLVYEYVTGKREASCQ